MNYDGKFLMLIVIIFATGLPKLIKFIYSIHRDKKELERIDNNEFDWSDV